VVVPLHFEHVMWVVGQPLGCFVGSLVVDHRHSESVFYPIISRSFCPQLILEFVPVEHCALVS